jgi:hypothetical protein
MPTVPEIITENVIKQLEPGVAPWHKPCELVRRKIDATVNLPMKRGRSRVFSVAAGGDALSCVTRQYDLRHLKVEHLGPDSRRA